MLAVVLCATVFAPAALSAPVTAGTARILYYEPFNSTSTAAPAGQQKSSIGAGRGLRFNAYGRRFDLALEKNSRLSTAAATAGEPTLSLYRGTIENAPGSWVRLSAKGQAIRGMMWDTHDLYVIELADAVRESLESAPSQPPEGATIIFKLADTLVENAASFCETDPNVPARSGKDSYQSLLQELKASSAIQQAPGATVRLELSVLGDTAFRARYPSDPLASDEILLRLNNVDGIFSSQLGVEIQVPTLLIATAETDALSTTTVPSTLLQELGQLRGMTPQLRSRGLTHLFTGRDLDGNTVGIAYQDTLCRQEFGAGLTEASGRGSWIESLIAAHEIGHNFGAPHDGTAACAATPQGQFLMSPSVTGVSTFSDCSLQVMMPRVQSASCIVAMPPADLSIPSDLGTVRQPVSRQFAWDLTVVNAGGSLAVAANAEILVPPVVQIDDAWVAGGSCTSGAGVISCQLGDIAGSASRVVHLTLHSDVVGTNSISARVSAQSDAQAANNEGAGALVIEAQADLAVTLQAAAAVEAGASVTASFSAANVSAIDASTVNVEFTLSNGIAATSAQLTGGNCFVAAQSFRCTLPALAAGATATGTVTINAVSSGTNTVQARILSSGVDPNAANDVVVREIAVGQPAVNSMQGGSGKGGGGSMGAVLLLGLSGLLYARRRRAAPRHPPVR